MIEVNALPGLAIQMANGVGLLKRLEPIVEEHRRKPGADLAEKIAFPKNFRAKLPLRALKLGVAMKFALVWSSYQIQPLRT